MTPTSIAAVLSPYQALGEVRVLVVDDDEVDRLTVGRLLAQAGMNVRLSESRSAEEAVVMARATTFECILLDYNLPGHDGLYALRKLAGSTSAPVVILSGQEDPMVSAELIKQGAIDYLTKDALTPLRLADAVRHATELHRARAAAEQTRNALRASEELNRALLDSSPDSVKILDLEGRLLSMSAGGARMLELEDVQQVLHRPWQTFWRPEDAALVTQALDTARHGGVGRFEAFRPSHRGRPLWWEVMVSPIRNAHGAVERLLAISRDVTDRKRREQFEEQLIGIVSHDLRNPINAILLGVDALGRHGDLTPKQRQVADRLRRSADRATRMICDLLDFTQARLAGGLKVERRETDVVELARHVIDEAVQARPGRDVLLDAPDRLVGRWDPDRLGQLLSNLVSNAIQYSASESVRVSLRADPHALVLTVHNDGAPIPSDRMPHIFEPFQRGTSADQASRSIGLGLYIVAQIAAAHGGSVEAHSSARKGTTFTVELPRGLPSSALHGAGAAFQ